MTESEARSKIKYRIGVIKEIAGNRYDVKFCEDLEIAIQALKEIREYRELGTVEELQALKEKNEPKKIKGIRFTEAICPSCKSELFETYWTFGGIHYCNECGQEIDWD